MRCAVDCPLTKEEELSLSDSMRWDGTCGFSTSAGELARVGRRDVQLVH